MPGGSLLDHSAGDNRGLCGLWTHHGLAQATDPNEPILGALWSFLGNTFAIPSGKNACGQW